MVLWYGRFMLVSLLGYCVPYAASPRMRIVKRIWISRRENQKILLPKKSIASENDFVCDESVVVGCVEV